MISHKIHQPKPCCQTNNVYICACLSISVFLIRGWAYTRTQARGGVIDFDRGKQNQWAIDICSEFTYSLYVVAPVADEIVLDPIRGP